jgi:hypothetical protein
MCTQIKADTELNCLSHSRGIENWLMTTVQRLGKGASKTRMVSESRSFKCDRGSVLQTPAMQLEDHQECRKQLISCSIHDVTTSTVKWRWEDKNNETYASMKSRAFLDFEQTPSIRSQAGVWHERFTSSSIARVASTIVQYGPRQIVFEFRRVTYPTWT